MNDLITFSTQTEASDAIKADFICKAIGSTLTRHYPNRQWYVDVSIVGGVANILCPSISNRHGYTIHIADTADNIQKKAIRAGGQILEMFKLDRSKGAKGGEELILRDARGEAIHASTGL